jgi:hypothetical protein
MRSMVQPPSKTGQPQQKVPTATELAAKRKSTIDELRILKEKKAAEEAAKAGQVSQRINTAIKPAPVNVKEYKGIPAKQSSNEAGKTKVSVYEPNQGCCRRFFSKVKNFFSN